MNPLASDSAGIALSLRRLPPSLVEALQSRVRMQDALGFETEVTAFIRKEWADRRESIVALPTTLSLLVERRRFTSAVLAASEDPETAPVEERLPADAAALAARAAEGARALPEAEAETLAASLAADHAREEAEANHATPRTRVEAARALSALGVAFGLVSVLEVGITFAAIASAIGYGQGAPPMPVSSAAWALTFAILVVVAFVGMARLLRDQGARLLPEQWRRGAIVLGAGGAFLLLAGALTVLRGQIGVTDAEVTSSGSALTGSAFTALVCLLGVLGAFGLAALWSAIKGAMRRLAEIDTRLAALDEALAAVEAATARVEALVAQTRLPTELQAAWEGQVAHARDARRAAHAHAVHLAVVAQGLYQVLAALPPPILADVFRRYAELVRDGSSARALAHAAALVLAVVGLASGAGCASGDPTRQHVLMGCDGTGAAPQLVCTGDALVDYATSWAEDAAYAPGSTLVVVASGGSLAETREIVRVAAPSPRPREDVRVLRAAFRREAERAARAVVVPQDPPDVPSDARVANHSHHVALLATLSRVAEELPPGRRSLVVMSDGWLVAPDLGIATPRDPFPPPADIAARARETGYTAHLAGFTSVTWCGAHAAEGTPADLRARDAYLAALIPAFGGPTPTIRTSCRSGALAALGSAP